MAEPRIHSWNSSERPSLWDQSATCQTKMLRVAGPLRGETLRSGLKEKRPRVPQGDLEPGALGRWGGRKKLV